MITCLHDTVFDTSCIDAISYGFYGRTGGVSTGLYDSLNCAAGSGDSGEAVLENRARVAAHLGFEGRVLSSPFQCHSADCLTLDAPLSQGADRPKADALVTDVPGLPLGILTADCGPVLFAAKKADGAPVIGAAHAGWGGALKGVLEETVCQMLQMGAALETISACVGPCIVQGSYEVGEDFALPFLREDDGAEKFFMAARKSGHLMFDLSGYIAFRLARAGVKRVSLMGRDTYAEEDLFFSYRRTTHRGAPDYGRQVSAIVIR